jgi:hypothetical protein
VSRLDVEVEVELGAELVVAEQTAGINVHFGEVWLSVRKRR